MDVKAGLALGPAVVDTDAVVLGTVAIAIVVLDEWAATGTWLGVRLLALLVADGAGVMGSLLVVMVFAARAPMVAVEVVGVPWGLLMTVEALTVVVGPLLMLIVVVVVEGGAGVARADGAL